LASFRKGKYGIGKTPENHQQAHAIANDIYVASVNRMVMKGRPPLDYGFEVLLPATHLEYFWKRPKIAKKFCYSNAIESSREYAAPLAFLRDRRIDSYGDIVRRLID
jgi:hypothetical protein